MTSNSATANVVNIVARKGDSFIREFRFFEDAAKTTPQNITANTYKATVARRSSGQAPVVSFEIGAGFTITAPNILRMEASAASMNIEAGQYQWDIQQTSAGVVTTLAMGTFTITDDITV